MRILRILAQTNFYIILVIASKALLAKSSKMEGFKLTKSVRCSHEYEDVKEPTF